MKERPILFSAPMVRALLEGRKTQTRRIMKPQPEDGTDCPYHMGAGQDRKARVCPYGQPGDRLWVRETFAYHVQAIGAKRDEDGPFVYKADGTEQCRLDDKWKPSIFMPRWASRILLEIIAVRVERLQDISEEDARSEGVANGGCLNCGCDEPCGCTSPHPDARDSFISLWESINGAGSWDANPFVWILEFQRIEP
jgi:hypothetical protein